MSYLLHELVEEQATGESSERTAVVDGSRELSYRELDQAANQLANLLIDLGVSRGDRVGLYLEKSLEAVVGVYGVLKTGAAYVPLDPQAPATRLSYIASNCAIRCLVTGVEKESSWGEVSSTSTIENLIVMNGDPGTDGDLPPELRVFGTSDIGSQSKERPTVPVVNLDLSYILYTSGSTGVPKGVMLSHLNALSFVQWAVDEFEVDSSDRLSSHAPFHFDLSVFDLFAAAKAGAAVVLVPPKTSYFPVEIARFIEEERISVWYSVPSILSMLVLRGGLQEGRFTGLRTVLFAGEVFPTKFLRRLINLVPSARFVNLYGPTETNVCTYYEVTELGESDDPIPIGRAIRNVEVFALTEEGRVAQAGDVGELLVRGTTVMQGYWGDPERTKRGLVSYPLSEELQDPTYRTGDRVQQDEEGFYRLLGRKDHQIKSRGYRIELGDIESAIYSHPSVTECAVIAVPDELITNRIKAYVVAREGLTQAELVGHCSERVPRYMVPEAFEFQPELPKTSTGKINRQALAKDIAPA